MRKSEHWKTVSELISIYMYILIEDTDEAHLGKEINHLQQFTKAASHKIKDMALRWIDCHIRFNPDILYHGFARCWSNWLSERSNSCLEASCTLFNTKNCRMLWDFRKHYQEIPPKISGDAEGTNRSICGRKKATCDRDNEKIVLMSSENSLRAV